MRILKRCILGAVTLAISGAAMAALPAPGLWSIDDEANGKPGRGIQIDRQGGETVIVSYYGYREDGSSVFYQAVGKITGGTTFKADLIEYQGGTVIGGAMKDATQAKTIGPIQAVFSTDTSGRVTLPGEQTKSFSQFHYEDHRQRLNNEFLVSNFNVNTYYDPGKVLRLKIKASDTQLTMRISTLGQEDEGYSLYSGTLVRKGSGFSSTGRIESFPTHAGPPAEKVDMTFENLAIDDRGILSTTFRKSETSGSWQGEGTLLGMCYAMPEVVITGSMPEPCTPQHLGLAAK